MLSSSLASQAIYGKACGLNPGLWLWYAAGCKYRYQWVYPIYIGLDISRPIDAPAVSRVTTNRIPTYGDTIWSVKRDLPKCRSRHMAESPNSSLTAFCNGRHTVKGGSIPSSNFERSCFEWSNQNLWKDWKVIAVEKRR